MDIGWEILLGRSEEANRALIKDFVLKDVGEDLTDVP